MATFIERPLLPEEDRFPSLSELLEDFLVPQLSQQSDPLDGTRVMAMYVEQMKLDVPIEVQPQRDMDNRLVLGTTPPTQWIETSVQPVLHQLRITLELDDDESGQQALES